MKGYKPTKQDINKTNQNHQNENKNMYTQNLFLLIMSINLKFKSLKKNKHYQKNYQRDHLATEINATKVTNKKKDKLKNLSHMEYYIYK